MIADTCRRLYERAPQLVRSGAGTLMSHVPVDYRYGAAFRAARRFLASSEGWSQTAADDWQAHRLANLLNFASAEVPYYRDLLGRTGFPIGAEDAFRVLGEMPLLTRDLVRTEGERLAPRSFVGLRSRYVTTGGTSGHPLGFLVSYEASAVEWAFILHAWLRAGVLPNDRRLVIRGTAPSHRRRGDITELDPLNRALILSSFDLSPAALSEAYPTLLRFHPQCLHAYPSSAMIFGEWLAQSGRTLPELRCLLLGSENLYPWQRAHVEALYGAPVYAWYGHSEKCVLAAECEHGGAYHPFWQYGITELTDASGEAIDEPGVNGYIVGTGFINPATVLIRYLTDDQATWCEDMCRCGRLGRRLEQVVGRWNQEYLVADDGALIPMAAINMHSRAYASIAQFQFHQQTAGRATLRIVPGGSFSVAGEAELMKELDSKLGGRIALTVEHVSAIPLAPSGKFKFIDQQIDTSPSGGAMLDNV